MGKDDRKGMEDSVMEDAHESHGGEEEYSTRQASAVVSPSSEVQADHESPNFQILTYMTQQQNILLTYE